MVRTHRDFFACTDVGERLRVSANRPPIQRKRLERDFTAFAISLFSCSAWAFQWGACTHRKLAAQWGDASTSGERDATTDKLLSCPRLPAHRPDRNELWRMDRCIT